MSSLSPGLGPAAQPPSTSPQIIAMFGELQGQPQRAGLGFGRTGGTKPQLYLSKERASDKPLSRPGGKRPDCDLPVVPSSSEVTE